MNTMHVLINGFVQGVGFRYFTMQAANSLEITGYARNTATGEVEVVAQAEREVLEDFLSRLRQGPSFSKVKNIRVTWPQVTETYTQFTIK